MHIILNNHLLKFENLCLNIATSYNFYVTVKDNSRIHPRTLNVRVGDYAAINCEGQSLFRWYHNSLMVAPFSSSQNLIFESVIPEDAGHYYCISENIKGKKFIAKAILVIFGMFNMQSRNLSHSLLI